MGGQDLGEIAPGSTMARGLAQVPQGVGTGGKPPTSASHSLRVPLTQPPPLIHPVYPRLTPSARETKPRPAHVCAGVES
jgi:hypothetical protein